MILPKDHEFKNASEAYAWLNLTDDEFQAVVDSSFNPLTNLTEIETKTPGLREMLIMQNPEYLYFFCKVFLNLEIYPLQSQVLQELSKYNFSILLASRGFGKSSSLAMFALIQMVLNPGIKVVVVGAAFRQSKFIFNYAEKIWKDSPVLQSMYKSSSDGPRVHTDRATLTLGKSVLTAIPVGDGCLIGSTLITNNTGSVSIDSYFEDRNLTDEGLILYEQDQVLTGDGFRISDEKYFNGIKDVIEVTTHKGYNLTGTHNHRIKVLDGLDVVFKRLDELTLNDVAVIDRHQDWHPDPLNIPEDECYALGAMIGNGCYTNKYWFRYTGMDSEIVDSLNKSEFFDFYKCNDELHWQCNGINKTRAWLDFWGLKRSYAHEKELPVKLMAASKESVAACLSGLMDTDGTLQISHSKGGTACSVSYCSTSEKLVRQMQFLLLKFGIVSILRSRMRTSSKYRIYELQICGENARLFYEQIGFKLARKKDLLKYGFDSKIRHYASGDVIPNIKERLIEFAEKYWKAYPAKTKQQVYLNPKKIKERVNISYAMLEFCLERYGSIDDPIIDKIRYLVDQHFYFDPIVSLKEDVAPTYDLHVPDNHEYVSNGFISHNSKIRGERANIIMADEFNSINLDVYQTVIQNFAAVSADPIGNMKKRAYKKILQETGQWQDSMEEYFEAKANKSIISGTMGSDWEPLNEYINKYKAIIKSRGNTEHMKDIFGEDVPDSVNWKNFMVATIPVELIPDGFMDSNIVEQGRYTLDIGIYMAEFGCCPISDTNGFYKKSLIDGCTANRRNIEGDYWPEWCPNEFSATVQGARNKRYVFGIDPAHTSDNFAIVILEIHENHSRVVYCWTTNKKAFADQSKTSDENNYFAYCARKIRNLMEKFPCEAIVMDAQGGGRAVEEALRDQDKLLEGELPLWPVIDPDKREETDTKTGLHILHMVNMTQPWNADANYALQKDLYDKIVLFPSFDTIGAGLATELNVSSSDYDRLDDCMLEIEELKKELITIVKSRTPSGKERWDTPDTITGSHALSSKSMNRMRKDRFSALLLANSIARGIKLRNLGNFISNRNNYSVGVAGGNLYKTNNNRSAYIGNPEITKNIKLSNYRGITR